MVNILFFGQLADIAQQELGCNETHIALSTKAMPTSIHQLCIEIGKKSSILSDELKKTGNLCAVNQHLCPINTWNDNTINTDDEVAFMSPLSGG